MSNLPASRQWKWTAPGPAARADRAVLEALSATDIALTRNQLQKLMAEGRVLANGQPLKAGTPLTGGEAIIVEIPAPRSMELVPEERELEFLYEDEHLLVINKPQGLTVHPSTTQTEGTLVHALLHRVKDLSGIGGVLRPGIVHRLDKNTSGAMVVTKTDAAHRKLVEVFSAHRIERAYWALCYGAPPSDARVKVESLIGRSPSDRTRMSMKVAEGRRAVTYYRRLEAYGRPKPFASFLEMELETGRTHQIRVHLTGSGFSVLGDPTYGTPTPSQPKWKALPREAQALVSELPGQALHARVLGFEHPVTGRAMRWEAQPPAGFVNLHSLFKKWT